MLSLISGPNEHQAWLDYILKMTTTISKYTVYNKTTNSDSILKLHQTDL